MDIEALKAKLGEDAPALQGLLDAAAASARKTEKAKADAAQARIAELEAAQEAAANAGKSESEKLKLDYDKAVKRAKELEDRAAKAETDFRNHRRGSAIMGLFGKHQFVDPAAADLVKPAFSAMFADVADEDLANAETVKPILEAFAKSAKAILADTSGHGSGDSSRPKSSTSSRTITRADFDALPPAKRDAHLKAGGTIT